MIGSEDYEVVELVSDAMEEEIQSFMVAVLMEYEKLLLHFNNRINKPVTREDYNNYIRHVDKMIDYKQIFRKDWKIFRIKEDFSDDLKETMKHFFNR